MFGITGRKGRAGGHCKLDVKSLGLTQDVRPRLRGLNTGEGRGIPGVEVKCVDIRKNTGGEGGLLDWILTLRLESVGSKQD